MIYNRNYRGSNIFIVLRGKVSLSNNSIVIKGQHFGDEIGKGSDRYLYDAFTKQESHVLSLNMNCIASLKQ